MDDKQLQTFRKIGGDVVTSAVSEGKDFWQSKTFWASVLMAVVPLYPPAAALVAAYPAVAGAATGGIVLALRHLTDSSLKWPWSK